MNRIQAVQEINKTVGQWLSRCDDSIREKFLSNNLQIQTYVFYTAVAGFVERFSIENTECWMVLNTFSKKQIKFSELSDTLPDEYCCLTNGNLLSAIDEILELKESFYANN